ncbi:DUF6929 family protein [Ahniella affigens]|nr:hypothetical protein [Ahniella affigens]
MIATQLIRSLDVSAASGLVWHDRSFWVVADDENALFVFGRDGDSRRIPLLPGELPSAHADRKAVKPDFEVLCMLPGTGLLVMGSGSRVTRMQAVLVDHNESCFVIDTKPLCAALTTTFPALNLEGATVLGDELVLLQRGNRGDRRNALIFLALEDLRQALASRSFEVLRAPRVVVVDLGQQGEIPWSCTDLTVLADGDLLVSAVLEDTGDAYQDGACLGSSLARLGADGALRWHQRLDTANKIEGIAVDGANVWLVSDADDRNQPSQLLRAMLP